MHELRPESRSASAGQFVAAHLIQRSQLQPVRKAHERPSGGVGHATKAVGHPPTTFSRARPLSCFAQTARPRRTNLVYTCELTGNANLKKLFVRKEKKKRLDSVYSHANRR